jgi:SAM-dependent methyltransferase
MSVRRRLRIAARVLFADSPLMPRRPEGPPAHGPAQSADGNGRTHPTESPHSACPPSPIIDCPRCPVCDATARTLVSEFNRFLLYEAPPDEAAPVYDYSLCHGCGVVYATKRPSGARYQWLFHHFEETLGRLPWNGAVAKLSVSTFELSEDEKAELRRRAARGVFVSEHEGVSRKEYLPVLSGDRLANSAHVELLGSLLDLRGARLLEIRSRAGSIGAGLRRLYGADPYAMAIFENQRFVIEEVYGIPTSLIDFESFSIPHAGPFDLVVSNHMLTHAVRPRDFLATVRTRLRPGGYLYLYNEPDDAEYLSEGKSMFSTMNAFHLQTFDGKSLVRALAANGFSVMFLTRFGGHFLCLSRMDDEPRGRISMDDLELERRRKLYLQARDTAILMVPPKFRDRVGPLWEGAAERALAAGTAEIGEKGDVRIRRAAKSA